MDTKNKNEYLEILLWMYNQPKQTFKHSILHERFSLGAGKRNIWFEKVFNGEEKLILHVPGLTTDEKDEWCLSSEGITRATSYVELQEAKSSGKRAEWLAVFAVIISIAVGFVQILVSLFGKVEIKNFPDLQNVNIQNEVINTIVTNLQTLKK